MQPLSSTLNMQTSNTTIPKKKKPNFIPPASRGGIGGRGRGRGRGRGNNQENQPRTWFCQFHGEGSDHSTGRCPITIQGQTRNGTLAQLLGLRLSPPTTGQINKFSALQLRNPSQFIINQGLHSIIQLVRPISRLNVHNKLSNRRKKKPSHQQHKLKMPQPKKTPSLRVE